VDRGPGEEDGRSAMKEDVLRRWRSLAVSFLFFLSVFGYNGTGFSEEAPEDANKITLEKVQIIGAVERPETFFNIPWRPPEAQEKVNFEFSRDFKKEIFQFLDRDEFMRRYHGMDR
jgi:hypothetical protein